VSESYAVLRELASGDGADALRANLLLWRFVRPSYNEWVERVEDSIAFEVAQISRRKADLQGLDEDGITALLVIALESLGLDASSAVVNGNCDVVVSYAAEYQWLGEAKIFKGVAVVWGGYLQLTRRYAAALPGQDRGGMLLYCFKNSATELLDEWRAALSAQVPTSNAQLGRLPLSFSSRDACQATGLEFSILHFAFPLLHKPVEDTVKLTEAAFQAAKSARKASRQGE